MLGNKEIMARNIKRYMDRDKVNATEICRTLGFKSNTFSDWVNAKAYPRIDKIELMAKYFGIQKSDLIEDKGIKIGVPQWTLEKIAEEINKKPSYQFTEQAIDMYEKYLKADLKTQSIVRQLLDMENE